MLVTHSYRRSEVRFTVVSIMSVLGLLALWELLPLAGLVNRGTLPPPTSLISSVGTMFASPNLSASHAGLGTAILTTLARYAIGFIVGGGLGFVSGLILSLIRWVRVALEPAIAIFYPIPRMALIPLVLLLVGANELGMIITILIAPFFIMLISTMSAFLNVDRAYIEIARSFDSGRWDIYRRIVAPASMPILLSAARLALIASLFGTITIEFLEGTSGLGYLIWNSYQSLQSNQAFVAIIFASLIGNLSYGLATWVERRLVRWA